MSQFLESEELKGAHTCKRKTEDTTKKPKGNANGKSAVWKHQNPQAQGAYSSL